jgi:hypothetical protein
MHEAGASLCSGSSKLPASLVDTSLHTLRETEAQQLKFCTSQVTCFADQAKEDSAECYASCC